MADAKDVFNWPPLESDPAIFTKYLREIGMDKGWKIGEVWGLDDEMLAFVPQPTVACIAAIERVDKSDGKPGNSSTKASYYMKQTKTLDNACGIIACLHSLFNNSDFVTVEDGSVLQEFRDKATGISPEDRATLMEGFTKFQETHKAYAMQGQSNLAASQNEVNHHFVAFCINSAKQLIELDGTKDGPAVIKDGVTNGDLLKSTAEELKRRIAEKKITESMSLLTLSVDQDQ